MKTIITAGELNEMFQESYEEQSASTTPNGLVERQFSCRLSTGAGSFTDYTLDGLYIGFGELRLKRTTQIHTEADRQKIQLVYVFSGQTVMQHQGLRSAVTLEDGQYNLFYLHEDTGQQEWMNHSNKSHQGLEICLTPAFITQFLPEDSPDFQHFVTSMTKDQSTALTNYSPVITPTMMHIIRSIMHTNTPASLKKLFLYSRIMELLMLQFEHMYCGSDSRGISKQNKERMFEVKSFLEVQLEPTFSIRSLAKDFATNEFTLKKEFKQLFGKSIFDYWNEVRFNYAGRLLKEGYSIQQLADKMGYSSPQNFSTAFKRRFGIIPSAYKK